MGRDEVEDFERCIGIAVLNEHKDFEDLLGSEWKSKPPAKVDLSGSRYRLETLGGVDVAKGGLLNPQLKKGRLTYLDISDNRLHDINCLSKANGFEVLSYLLAKRNLIADTWLDLPKLVELNLSHNMLRQLPSLEKMPLLEVLMLSHNQLSGSLEGLKEAPRLKRLDLAHNQFDMNPSQFSKALEHMGRLRRLAELRLYMNPFVAFFKEYQVFVLKALPSLKILDDLDMKSLSDTLRYDIREREADIKDLAVYDEAFRKRKQQQEERNVRGGDDGSLAAYAGEGGVPRLKILVRNLEEVLQDNTLLQKNVAVAHEIAKCRAQHYKAFQEGEWGDIFWEDLMQDEFAVPRTMELITLVMERHDSVRSKLIETLGWLISVSDHGLGYECVRRLGYLMGSEHDKEEVLRTLEDIVVPLIKESARGGQGGLKGETTRQMVTSIVVLLDQPAHQQRVAKVMQHIIPEFVEWLKSTNKAQDLQDGRHIVHALAYLTDDRDNCLQVSSLEVAKKCTTAINNQSYALSDKYCELWLDFLKLSENLIRHSTDEDVVQTFKKDSAHVTCIGRGRDILEMGNLERNTLRAKTSAKICKFTAEMMMRIEQVLVDCCTSYLLTEYLCTLLKDISDPMVLAEGCRCLMVILRHPVMYKDKVKAVVQALGQLTPFMLFLGEQRYADLYTCALNHDKPFPQVVGEIEDDPPPPPPLALLDNALVCEAFCAVVELLAFFSQGEGDDVKDVVNKHLDKAGREQKLLRLLVVKSDNVRLAVMRCIKEVAISQIASEEMGMLIKCLSDTRNIEEGDTETVLALVMEQLEKLVSEETLIQGAEFRKHFAEKAMSEAFLILHQNAKRNTYGIKKEEEDKVLLSCSIVSFLRACSRKANLRDHLRSPQIEEVFGEILKCEEDLLGPFATDVAIEQTWIGRSIRNLLRCLSEKYALDRHKKVLLRVLSRIADVAEGFPDSRAGTGHFSLPEVAERESRMWNLRNIERCHLYLDDMERSDLQDQASDFAFCIEQILRHLMSLQNKAEEKENMDILQVEGDWFEGEVANAERRQGEKSRDEQKRLASVDVTQIDLHNKKEADDGPGDCGEAVLMAALHQYEDVIEEDNSHLFTVRPPLFERNELILLDSNGNPLPENTPTGVEYQVNKAFMVSAFLRTLHAVIMMPQNEECRQQVVLKFRKREMVARLLSLVAGVPYLNCHVAAKFLHVMQLVLDVGLWKGDLGVEILSLLSKYVEKVAYGMLNVLKLAKDRTLGVQEQTLCAEIGTFMAIVLRAVPSLASKITKPLDQVGLISAYVDRLVPAVIVRLLIAMIIYDLQMDLGGGDRKYIKGQFVKQAYNKVGMKDRATMALVLLLVRCPHHKYNVLEVFSVAEVFNEESVRPCYMQELLNDCNMGSYLLVVEKYLREQQSPEEEALRVVQLKRVIAIDPNTNGMVLRLMCATTRHLYLLAPPETRPPYAHSADLAEGWSPTWEVAFPRPPEIVWKRDYTEIACLYKCYGKQIIVIEWRAAGAAARGGHSSPPQPPVGGASNKQPQNGPRQRAFGSLKGAAEKPAAAESAPRRDFFVFQRAHARDDFITKLVLYSGERPDSRAPVKRDPGIRAEVMESIAQLSGGWADPAELVLAISVALYEPEVNILGVKSKGQKSPRLFVLTTKRLLIFHASLSSWQPQEHSEGLEDDDDEVELDLEEGVKHTGSPKGVEEAPDPPAVQTHNVLKLDARQDLPPKEVIFKTTAEADLTIKFKSSDVDIRFYDDTAREKWRRALAYILYSTTDKTWTREMPGTA